MFHVTFDLRIFTLSPTRNRKAAQLAFSMNWRHQAKYPHPKLTVRLLHRAFKKCCQFTRAKYTTKPDHHVNRVLHVSSLRALSLDINLTSSHFSSLFWVEWLLLSILVKAAAPILTRMLTPLSHPMHTQVLSNRFSAFHSSNGSAWQRATGFKQREDRGWGDVDHTLNYFRKLDTAGKR